MSCNNFFIKDPDATRNFGVDWSDNLDTDNTGLELVTSEWVIPADLTNTKESFDSDTGITQVWLAGGTEGQTYEVVNRVTFTDGGDDRTIFIKIEER